MTDDVTDDELEARMRSRLFGPVALDDIVVATTRPRSLLRGLMPKREAAKKRESEMSVYVAPWEDRS